MSKFKLTLTDNNHNDYSVFFDILNTDIASKWGHEVSQNYQLNETERFTNWPNTTKDISYYISKLNSCIDTVNEYKPDTISIRLTTDNPDQDTMNHLHKFFEDLRGHIDESTVFYKTAPHNVQQCLIDFNVYIHEYEHYVFSQRVSKYTNHPYSTIVGTLKCPRHTLNDDDYNHFTFDWRFGTVYINYCEVGKPLLDVFKDQDDHVGDLNIRPLNYYSADFQIKFGPSTLPEVYEQRCIMFKHWFDERKDFFKSLGIEWGPKLSLGLIPVASLNTALSGFDGLSEIDIVNLLSRYQKIKSVEIYE